MLIATATPTELTDFLITAVAELTPTSRITIEHILASPNGDRGSKALITPELLRLLAANLSKEITPRLRAETYVPAPVVARMLGIKTATLGKWRRHGRGPRGAIRTSDTSVVYPASEVEAFINEWSKGEQTGCR